MPLFKIHKIDGKELDRIREKNDSKVFFYFLYNYMVKIIFQDAETVGGSEGAAGSASNCFTVSHKFDLLKKIKNEEKSHF